MIYIQVAEFYRKTDQCLLTVLNIHAIHQYSFKLSYHINGGKDGSFKNKACATD